MAPPMPYYPTGTPPKYLYTDDNRIAYLGARYSCYFLLDQTVKIICDPDVIFQEDIDYENLRPDQATDEVKQEARDWSQLSFLQIAKWKCNLNPSSTT
jgi:hypothetical protein